MTIGWCQRTKNALEPDAWTVSLLVLIAGYKAQKLYSDLTEQRT